MTYPRPSIRSSPPLIGVTIHLFSENRCMHESDGLTVFTTPFLQLYEPITLIPELN